MPANRPGGPRAVVRALIAITATSFITLAPTRASAQCGPPDNTCVVTPANGARPINAWPSSDTALDWVAIDQAAAHYSQFPQYGVFDPPIVGFLQSQLDQNFPTNQPTCNYQAAANAMRNLRPTGVLGTYISGGDVRPTDNLRFYPVDALPLTLVPTSAYLAGTVWSIQDGVPRQAIDFQLAEARTWFASAVANELIARTTCLPEQKLSFVYMDNVRHPGSGYRLPANDACSVGDCLQNPRPPHCLCAEVPWSFTLSFLNDVRTRIAPHGLRLVCNVAGPIWGWPAADVTNMIAVTHGISHERPFEKNYCRNNLANLLTEIGFWQQWLAAGHTILWVPTQCNSAAICPACPTCGSCPPAPANQHEQRVMAAMAMMIRQPGQSVFVARDYFRDRPDWATWSAQFGTPLQDFQILSGHVAGAPIVLTRRFAGGRMSVNLGASLCVATAASSVQLGFGPVITQQPRSLLLCSNRSARFAVSAVGIGTVRYQWRRNGVNIAGATLPELLLPSVTEADEAAYSCLVSDNEAARSSNVVTLTVGDGRVGDTNGDGRVDNFDIEPFTSALVNPALATTCAFDANGDGIFDNFDITPMVQLLLTFGAFDP
ncbi:MAG: hypothetical protein HRU75_01485 [Planctomycetia bacterium]|nr:MAG: hypothetical protein HRU75_01485 [Planctomycetia bacterium]